MTLERAALGFGAVWSAAAFYAAATGRLLTAFVVSLTAIVAFVAAWALREPLVELPPLYWPGVITARCRVCGDDWSAESPEVGIWCDTVEAHYSITHELTPSVASALDVYRAKVMLHAQLAADVEDNAPP